MSLKKVWLQLIGWWKSVGCLGQSRADARSLGKQKTNLAGTRVLWLASRHTGVVREPLGLRSECAVCVCWRAQSLRPPTLACGRGSVP